ncbi:SIMPL domain-containing protein [Thermolongibacillus altinsuensis]|uniref:SIMPL domain-containing protein n=1 Tax=Thermolongibacillus altinsuensis TaxID=575256 RepID=UPI00242A2AB0|nr:SIMPL domain-containing protein [Thermolongibacillus altinsuensis]GMB08033.1 SIMPL domain-containing protein [Thermolongibacillus altinsuensis]
MNETMSVIGQGDVHAKPDTVIITLGVKTEHRNAKEAVSENAARSQAMIQALKKIGIGENDIETVSFSLYPKYDYTAGAPQIIGYEVEHLFDITVRQVQNAGAIYETATENGANVARNIQFVLKNANHYYQQALAQAVRNAREKAATIARTLGVLLYEIPFQVKETSTLPSVKRMAQTAVLAEGAPPIQTQEVTISATVQAVFAYHSERF